MPPPTMPLLGWLRANWPHLVLLPILAALLVWMFFLVRAAPSDLAAWLLVPLTGIYVVLTTYTALAGFRSAYAASRSAALMEASVRELQRTNFATFSPWLIWPEPEKQAYIPGANGSAVITLQNISDQPAFGLIAYIWELEANAEGRKTCRYSSQRQSPATDIPREVRSVISLQASNDTEENKRNVANDALQRFLQLAPQGPRQDALCALTFSTKLNPFVLLVYDLKRNG